MDPELLTCPFRIFEGYLPFSPDDRAMKICLQNLSSESSKGKAILADLGEGRYQLNDSPESEAGVTDFERHEFVGEISVQLRMCNVEGRSLTYRYFDCPNNTIHSDIKECSTYKIDGVMVPAFLTQEDLKKSAEHGHCTTNISVVCEWKIESSETVKLDVVSANVQIMNDDVRRMFSYGLTIEGKVMRVWYFSRSFSLVSEDINFVEHPEILVKVLASFMFATEKEMGYDPQVTRHSHIHYVYEIRNRFFRTEDVIASYRSNAITGRMARIWTVRQVDLNKQDAKPIGKTQCVLKDVWLESSAKTEIEIQRGIFHDIERFWKAGPPADQDLEKIWEKHEVLVTDGEYKDYFLRHEVDYSGETTKPYNKDFFVLKPGLFSAPKKLAPPGSPIPSKPHSNTHGRRLTVAQMMEENIESRQPVYDREFTSRKQYRVVFTERCQATVGQLPTLGQVIDILRQTLIRYVILPLLLWWVHRDISAGNILAYREAGGKLRAKLSDLEYAQKFLRDDDKVAGDPKTGTPYFMALEILQLSYLAFPPSSEPAKGSFSEGALASTFVRRPNRIETEPPPMVMHNFQHDSEPLWWILLWTMTCRVDHPPSRAYAKMVFDNTMWATPERYASFTQPRLDVKLRSVLKESISELAEDMENMRHYLLLHYRHRYGIEKLKNPCSYAGIHNIFDGFFLSLAERKDLNWPSAEPLSGYAGSMDDSRTPAPDDANSSGKSDTSQSEELDQSSIAAPKQVIRLITEASSSRSSKRRKIGK